MIVKVRPEHIPHVLRMFDVELGYRKQLVKTEYFGYSRDVILGNLDLCVEDNTFEIVSSIDDFCKDCPQQEDCKETDATLFGPFHTHLQRLDPIERPDFLKKALSAIARADPYLAEAIPFTYLIGNTYSLNELRHIRDNPQIILECIS